MKTRSVAASALAVAGLVAGGTAILWKTTEPPTSAALEESAPVLPETPETALAPEPEVDPDLISPPDVDSAALERRKMAMTGSADQIEAARKDSRVGGFRSIQPSQGAAGAPNAEQKLGAEAGAAPDELRRNVLQSEKSLPQKMAQAADAGPIEFIVKLKDKALTDDLRALYQKSPDLAAKRLKAELGGGRLIGAARLQGFTLGGEAILRWEGPVRIADYGARQAEIQRALSAAPGVSYAEQNYTAQLQAPQ